MVFQGKINMTELKTLKDLRFKANHQMNIDCSSDTLRQEAIKWIKNLSQNRIYETNEINFGCQLQIEWIKMFFNITEDDLR
jgi:hypothetical protein